MTACLDHTIVAAHDQLATAQYFSDTLGLSAPKPYGPFLMVKTDNGVSLDVKQVDGEITSQHYAFLVTEDEFDVIFGRIVANGQTYWADPRHEQPGVVSDAHGRGIYFADPNGHNLEIITKPYDAD